MARKFNKKSGDFDAMLDKMAYNDHIQLDNMEIKVMFLSKTCRFLDTRLLKIGNAPNDPRMTLTTLLSKYPLYTECSPPRLKLYSISLYSQPFSRYKLVENWKCTK